MNGGDGIDGGDGDDACGDDGVVMVEWLITTTFSWTIQH